MKARLLCRAESGTTLSFELAGDETVIGRSTAVAVTLSGTGVGDRHARVIWDGEAYWVEDMETHLGTFLNGAAVTREKLRDLDVITLGDAVDIIFVRPGEELEQDAISAARLVSLGGDAARYEIPVGETTIGRSEACNIVVDDGAVSKRHARLRRADDQLALEDLGSANGTFVNGERTAATLLSAGDELSLGGAVSFRVEIEIGRVSSQTEPIDLRQVLEATRGESSPQQSTAWKTRYESGGD